MELLHLISEFVLGRIPGLFALLDQINRTMVTAVADILRVPNAVVLVLGMLLALLCGLLAYRYVKIFLALIAADFGFFAGAFLYFAVQTETMPDWVNYVFGLVTAIVFFWLAYGRASYVWFAIVAVLGYCATRFYLIDDLWISIGGAFVLAMLSIAFFRILFVAFTSLGCGVLFMGFLSALLPANSPLRLQSRNLVFWGCVLVLSILFVIAQYWIYDHRKARSL